MHPFTRHEASTRPNDYVSSLTNLSMMSYFALDSNRPLGKLRTQLERRIIIDERIRIPRDLFRIAQFRNLWGESSCPTLI
jgi:hypothetical protein